MRFDEPTVLSKTGLKVGRVGIASSFGAPAAAYEEAFEKGCNYFTWGSFIKGRSSEMKTAIQNIIRKGKRDDLVVSVITYAHSATLTRHFLEKDLKKLGVDYADILLIGYYSKRPPQRVLDGAMELKERGLVRFLGITSHNRKLFPELKKEGLLDVFHLRYNAAHRGAEKEVFPFMDGDDRPGIVSFTATRWGQLLKEKKMPPDTKPPSALDCYRFVLSNPAVDVCMMGARNIEMMRENLKVLESQPMTEEELNHMRHIGDHIHGRF